MILKEVSCYYAASDPSVINDQIQKFSSSGTWLATWGSHGTAIGQFNYPSGVAVDGSGNVYVADSNNHRIEKRDSTTDAWTKLGGYFNTPSAVAVDTSGNVYVADTGNNRIQKFNSNGVYLTQCGSQGAENGQFNYPYGVAVDSSGNVYVADTVTNRIQKVVFKYTVTVNSSGTGSGSVTSSPGGINYTYPATQTGTSTPLDPGQSATLTASATGSSVSWNDCAANGGTVSGNGTANATCTFASLGGDKTPNLTFTSNTTPPTVTTTSATGITATGATLNGTVNPNESSTTAYFQWGLTTSYGSTTSSQSMGSGTSAVAIPGGSLSGLTCNTAYHYQAVGNNGGGTSNGLDMTFLTSTCPVAGTIFISKDGLCNGNIPCFPTIQNGIASTSAPSIIKITQETYNENIILDFNQVIALQGGWDTNFTSNSSYTTINGSITLTNGTMIIENIILQ